MSAPVGIRVRREARRLELTFDDGSIITLPAELLRVLAPMPPGQSVLVAGKRLVTLLAADPIGNYALRLVFDDGHDTGLYSWTLLHELGRDAAANWSRYLDRCAAAGVRHGV